ncbi:MAG: hypothetical protein IPO58_26515 [Betaproteobacteria bacterium]|nr:hypothetical protein [Betaproteobacteria bacterium]
MPPSRNDQIASGIAGTFLGEAMFRMASSVARARRRPPEVLARALAAAAILRRRRVSTGGPSQLSLQDRVSESRPGFTAAGAGTAPWASAARCRMRRTVHQAGAQRSGRGV